MRAARGNTGAPAPYHAALSQFKGAGARKENGAPHACDAPSFMDFPPVSTARVPAHAAHRTPPLELKHVAALHAVSRQAFGAVEFRFRR
jgi:hypothetical protein